MSMLLAPRIDRYTFGMYAFVRLRLRSGPWWYGYVVEPVDTAWEGETPLSVVWAVYGARGGFPLYTGGRPASPPRQEAPQWITLHTQ